MYFMSTADIIVTIMVLIIILLLLSVIVKGVYETLTITLPKTDNPRFRIEKYNDKIYLKFKRKYFWAYIREDSYSGYSGVCKKAFYSEHEIKVWIEKYFENRLLERNKNIYLGDIDIDYTINIENKK